MKVGADAIPVRIRNVSRYGALLEGANLPALGAQVSLVRGQLHASGQLIWHNGKMGGIRFGAPIHVEPWVKRVGHSGQQQVDAVLATLRSSNRAPVSEDQSEDRSLPDLSAALDQVCNELAASAHLSIELGERLLRLDFVAQEIRRLATGKAF